MQSALIPGPCRAIGQSRSTHGKKHSFGEAHFRTRRHSPPGVAAFQDPQYPSPLDEWVEKLGVRLDGVFLNGVPRLRIDVLNRCDRLSRFEPGRFRPAVIVSDIAMPGHDGYELLRRVRAHADSRIANTCCCRDRACARRPKTRAFGRFPAVCLETSRSCGIGRHGCCRTVSVTRTAGRIGRPKVTFVGAGSQKGKHEA
jgi:CheY-like chemotaxis protein